MKKQVIIFLVLLVPLSALTQPRKYRKSMEKAAVMLDEATGSVQFLECAETYEGISSKYADMWLPSYYAAFSLIIANFEVSEPSTKEVYLNRVKKFVNKAVALNPEESEVQALNAFYAIAMMAIDPEINGPAYLEEFNYCNEKAKSLNPENPRPYYMEGLLKEHLPEFLGGGAAAAKALHQTAAEKYNTFNNDDPFWPDWGKDLNQERLDYLQ